VSTLLAKRGADLSAEEHCFGRSPLHLCAERGFPEILEMLVVRGASLAASGDALYRSVFFSL
jgi:hypothetical protein